MVVGVIYRYVSPSGKSYVGQTTNEPHRRATWFCTRQHYAGEAIDAARLKYGPENFQYEVLHKKHYFNKKEATEDLDKWECYYIGYFDSYKNGYNLTSGGDLTNRGVVRTDEWRKKQHTAHKGKSPSQETRKKLSEALTGKKHSQEASISSKEKRRASGLCQQIGQYDESLKLVKIWSNGAEAAECLKIHSSNIYRATRTLGIYMGYYWRKYNGEQTVLPKPKKIIKKPKAQKKVVQMNMNGEVLHTYNSIGDACKAVGANNRALMSRCLNKKAKTAYGFMWKFLNYA